LKVLWDYWHLVPEASSNGEKYGMLQGKKTNNPVIEMPNEDDEKENLVDRLGCC
jgi:hypothetical protein